MNILQIGSLQNEKEYLDFIRDKKNVNIDDDNNIVNDDKIETQDDDR